MSRRSVGGFSLLEILLAASLGVVATAALVQLFAASSRSNVLVSGEASLQESVRHAFEFLARSARGAGYLGCSSGVDVVNGLNGAWERVVEVGIAVAVDGFDGVGAGTGAEDWNPALSALPLRGVDGTGQAFKSRNRIAPARLRPGSDVVVFRRVEAPLHRLAAPWTDADPLAVILGEDSSLAGDFALVTDCRQAALVRIDDPGGGPGRTTLTRPAGSGLFDNRPVASVFADVEPFGDVDQPAGAGVARVVTEVYFVAEGSGTNNRNDDVWSLWRKTSTRRAVELVQGIDDMEILFGVDGVLGDGSRAPTRYVPAQDTTDPVRTVRVSLVASSVDAVTTDGQALSRRFSRTFVLRNP